MAMELYTKKGGRHKNPIITITRAGGIGLNSACMQKYLKGYDFILLYRDEKTKTIGIKPIKEEQENAFKISYSKNKSTGAISGHSFLAYAGIDYKSGKGGRYVPEWDENQKMLIIKTA